MNSSMHLNAITLFKLLCYQHCLNNLPLSNVRLNADSLNIREL